MEKFDAGHSQGLRVKKKELVICFLWRKKSLVPHVSERTNDDAHYTGL